MPCLFCRASLALGASKEMEDLKPCGCPVPRQGQGAAAWMLAGLRLYPVPRWTFCSVFSNHGEEPTLCLAAWTLFFAFGSPPNAGMLCLPAVPVASKCRQAEQ